MGRPVARVEIYYREKGKKRWLRTGKIFPLQRIVEAQRIMNMLKARNKGKKEFLIKPWTR